MTASARKFPLWATLFTLLALALLCTLGTWQIKRAAWKHDLLTQLDELANSPPRQADSASITVLLAGPHATPFLAHLELRGDYLPHHFLIGPRTHQGISGYHLLTPLRLQDGGTVLINRGWIKDKTQIAVTGPVTVSGLLRRPDRVSSFTPPNDPAQDIWHQIDLPPMAAKAQLDTLPAALLYAQSESPATDNLVYHQAIPTLPDNHRSYAFFWFSMAGVLLVIYALRFLRRAPTS